MICFIYDRITSITTGTACSTGLRSLAVNKLICQICKARARNAQHLDLSGRYQSSRAAGTAACRTHSSSDASGPPMISGDLHLPA